MPGRVVRMAIRALPVRIWISRGRPAESITLGEPAGFGIATLLFLDLGKEQAQSALVQAFAPQDFDLMTGLAGQSGVECDPRQ